MADWAKYKWAKLRSWHVVTIHTRGFNGWITRCGRGLDSPDVRDIFPADERTCESCLRAIARDEAKA